MSWVLVGCCGLYAAYCSAFCSNVVYTLINEHLEEKHKEEEKLKREYEKVTEELQDIEKGINNITLDGSIRNYGNVVTYDYKRFLESKVELNTLQKNKNLYSIYECEEHVPINQIIYR